MLIVQPILMTMEPPLQSEVFHRHPTFSLDIETIDFPACKYVNFKDIPVCAPIKQFSLLLFNVRSCRKNFSEFVCIFHEYLSRVLPSLKRGLPKILMICFVFVVLEILMFTVHLMVAV